LSVEVEDETILKVVINAMPIIAPKAKIQTLALDLFRARLKNSLILMFKMVRFEKDNKSTGINSINYWSKFEFYPLFCCVMFFLFKAFFPQSYPDLIPTKVPLFTFAKPISRATGQYRIQLLLNSCIGNNLKTSDSL
jgi:hypothetical protein